jgi:hypothetical protein
MLTSSSPSRNLPAGVREPSTAGGVGGGWPVHTRGPAHPSSRLVTQLNEHWRVVDDPLQWVLQQRKGMPRNKNSGWQTRSFCRSREGLMRCIHENCCLSDQGGLRCMEEYRGVDGTALQQVRALPEWHVDWDQSGSSQTGSRAMPSMA